MNCSWCDTPFFPGETCYSISKGVITFGDHKTFTPLEEFTLYFHADCFEDFQILTGPTDSDDFISFNKGASS